MAHIRVGVRRSGKPPWQVDMPAEWIEIDGVRLPDTAMIFSVEHKAVASQLGEVTIKMHCGGYETVAIEDES